MCLYFISNQHDNEGVRLGFKRPREYAISYIRGFDDLCP
jgi:hypothetical protein